MLEDEGEALYPDSGLITDSRDGGPEESVSELVKLEDTVGSIGGDAAGKPLARHFGQDMGHLSGRSTPCGWGSGLLVPVLLDPSFIPRTGSPLPIGWGCIGPGVQLFWATFSCKRARVTAWHDPGLGKC